MIRYHRPVAPPAKQRLLQYALIVPNVASLSFQNRGRINKSWNASNKFNWGDNFLNLKTSDSISRRTIQSLKIAVSKK